MGMNALFNNTNYITSELPLRTGKNCCSLIVLLSSCFFQFVFFVKFFSEAFWFTLLYFVILVPKDQLDFFTTHLCISFLPSWNFKTVKQIWFSLGLYRNWKFQLVKWFEWPKSFEWPVFINYFVFFSKFACAMTYMFVLPVFRMQHVLFFSFEWCFSCNNS